MVTVDQLLRETVQRGGSDLHIKAESPPLIRYHGDLLPVQVPPLTSEQALALVHSILSEYQRRRFEEDLELDLAYEIPGVARFRGNVFQQRGHVQMVFRVIPLKIQTMEDLELPAVCRYFCERPRGLVLVTGPAGSGKSTTQAAMIDHINKKMPVHIVTVEDPVEFIHEDIESLINQRELDTDTHSFANALKYVLRQDPDVILIGEMRDLETIQLAITAAETGHLVFGTLHTTDAVQTIDRVIDVFPMHQQQQVRMQISVNLVGVISQTLLKRADGKGRVAAFETLVAVPAIRNLIREAKTHQIGSMIQTGMKQGMMSLDQNLANLVKKNLVAYEEALAKANNVVEFNALCGRETK
ncbi:MAG: type IV pilus twitching motility protein PilT [Armatimonadetes bacterium]|nr:type IV pilus twitching motility protein PilT [Armatimonadota bacterium]